MRAIAFILLAMVFLLSAPLALAQDDQESQVPEAGTLDTGYNQGTVKDSNTCVNCTWQGRHRITSIEVRRGSVVVNMSSETGAQLNSIYNNAAGMGTYLPTIVQAFISRKSFHPCLDPQGYLCKWLIYERNAP